MSRRPFDRLIRWMAAVLLLLLVVYGGVRFIGHHLERARLAGLPRFATDTCRRTYEEFYRDPSIEIRVVFGYKDARPARFVADRYERLIFVQRVLRACASSEDRVCGFTRDTNDADLFTREIPGPDGENRVVRLRVVQPSVGADDEENRKNPFQAWRTVYAQQEFLEGFAASDLVIYNGHSRAGGGPDFRPPRISGSGDIDFGWYQRNEPGFEPVLESLRNLPPATSRPKLVGFLSCASTTHFLGRMREIRPTLATLTSPRLLYFSEAMETSLEMLGSVLAMKCEPEFSEALKKAETRAGGARVSGFFRSI
jgi:hypothetical protein